MYERFTDRARTIMQLANEEAVRLNHEYIGTEHILLGMVREGAGVAGIVLKHLGVDLHNTRMEFEKLVPPLPDSVNIGKLPLSPYAKQVVVFSVEECQKLNHNYIGTEHLILGLARQPAGVAAQALTNLGVKLADIREEVLNLLGHGA